MNPPWHFSNQDVHRDLGITTVTEVVKTVAAKIEDCIHIVVQKTAITCYTEFSWKTQEN